MPYLRICHWIYIKFEINEGNACHNTCTNWFDFRKIGNFKPSYMNCIGTTPLNTLTTGHMVDIAVEKWPDSEAVVSIYQGQRLTFKEVRDKVKWSLIKKIHIGNMKIMNKILQNESYFIPSFEFYSRFDTHVSGGTLDSVLNNLWRLMKLLSRNLNFTTKRMHFAVFALHLERLLPDWISAVPMCSGEGWGIIQRSSNTPFLHSHTSGQ